MKNKNRIKVKASGWSNKFLSIAEKIVMLQISPIPSYVMTCFKLLVLLCKRIQSAITRSWWDGRNKKMAWISWTTTMTKPKVHGGLGFQDFQSLNDAYLAKFSLRLINNLSCLLSKVFKRKYCHDSLSSKQPTSPWNLMDGQAC